MREVKSLRDVNTALKEIHDQLDRFRTADFELRGRRVRGASASVNDNDYVIRKELYDIREATAEVTGNWADEIEALKSRVSSLETQVNRLNTILQVTQLPDGTWESMRLYQIELDITSMENRIWSLEHPEP